MRHAIDGYHTDPQRLVRQKPNPDAASADRGDVEHRLSTTTSYPTPRAGGSGHTELSTYCSPGTDVPNNATTNRYANPTNQAGLGRPSHRLVVSGVSMMVLVGPNGTNARPRPVRAASTAGVCGALAAAVCWARRAREEAGLKT